MKIIQLTDLHIGMEEEDSFGVDVQNNFQFILEKVALEEPDLLVISGDLCLHEGRVGTYQWIKGQLQSISCPILFLSGNHDDPELLAQTLGVEHLLKGKELFGKFQIKNTSILFLDTSPATMSSQQHDWLKEELQAEDHPQVIFMHHPPAKAGLPFMDNKYPFREMELVQESFASSKRPLYIFCGHYHTEAVLAFDGWSVFITPSIYFQIDRNYPDFQVESTRIGFRWIEWDQEHLRTGVRYFDGFVLEKSS